MLDRRVRQALQDAGAILVRHNRHLIYKMPNGIQLTFSSSPSRDQTKYQLRDIERALKGRSPR